MEVIAYAIQTRMKLYKKSERIRVDDFFLVYRYGLFKFVNNKLINKKHTLEKHLNEERVYFQDVQNTVAIIDFIELLLAC